MGYTVYIAYSIGYKLDKMSLFLISRGFGRDHIREYDILTDTNNEPKQRYKQKETPKAIEIFP